MTRVKKGVNALKARKNILRRTKGFRHGRSTKERQAQEAIFHAGASAFAHRRDKKGDARNMWNVKISYASKELGTSYSKLMGGLKKKGVLIDRKILATLVEQNPETFKKIVDLAKIANQVATPVKTLKAEKEAVLV
ncbi:MAG: 50S ribosomal protein L20 [Parcubacteria group bacterium]